MLSKEQALQIKEKLLSEIDKSNIPNKEEIKKSINSMDNKQLEEFLNKNKLLEQKECIFCSIIENKIPNYKIEENKQAIAVLEINPISAGHILIIPKQHSTTINKEVTEFAQKIAEKVKIFKPKKIEIVTSEIFGHSLLNIFPVYDKENLNSPRMQVSEKELSQIQKKLTEKSTPKKQDKEEKEIKTEIISDKTHWLPKRIP